MHEIPREFKPLSLMDVMTASAVALTPALAAQAKADPRSDEFRREPDVIHAELRKSLGDTDISGPLEELLYQVHPDKNAALVATKAFVLKHARLTGVGFFSAKLQTWKHLAVHRGYVGYIKCRVKGCPWHLKIEEATRRRVCVYGAHLTHSNSGHVAIDASPELIAAQDGFNRIPEFTKERILFYHSAGQSPASRKRLIDKEAALGGLTASWNYDVTMSYGTRRVPS